MVLNSYGTYRLTRFGDRVLPLFKAYGTKLISCFQLSWSDVISLFGQKNALPKTFFNLLAVGFGTRVLLITLDY